MRISDWSSDVCSSDLLDQPITDNLRLVSTVLGSYTGNMLFKYGAYPGVLDNPESDSYWLVNARVGVKTMDDRYGFFIIADNLLDKVYYIGADAGTFDNLLNYGTRDRKSTRMNSSH